MSTRTIPSHKERLVAIAVLPMLTCSARLPIYALIIAAVIPSQTVLGVFNLQGITLFILYVAGTFSAALYCGYSNVLVAQNQNRLHFPY